MNISDLFETASRSMPLRGLLWLIVLAPLFYLSCSFANSVAEFRHIQASVAFQWEDWIPFRPWTILPYWSPVILCAISFFVRLGASHKIDQQQRLLDKHAKRLLLCLFLATICYLLIPLKFAYTPPQLDVFFAFFFAPWYSFDYPYNQLPSLHIALLILLAARFQLQDGLERICYNLWALLVAVSVLTTWQHHFLDIPTGLLLGAFVLWSLPNNQQGIRTLWQEGFDAWADTSRRGLAWIYFAGALTFFLWCFLGWILFGKSLIWFVIFWIGFSLFLVALIYARLGALAFRKQNGHFDTVTLWLFMPYLIGVWLNFRWWTRHHPQPDHVAERIWIGRMPTKKELERYSPQELAPGCIDSEFNALLDLTAELVAPVPLESKKNLRYISVPMLDRSIPLVEDIVAAVRQLDTLHRAGFTILVVCALGISRAPLVVATWLAFRSDAPLADALTGLRLRHPEISLSEDQILSANLALSFLREAKHAEALAEKLDSLRVSSLL